MDATGITLSRNQHAHVSAEIARRGLAGRVRMLLVDYRDLQAEPFDKIASVGMFEHVGKANMPTYFQRIHHLLRPGGLVLNHGITGSSADHTELSAGMGDFIEKYIFPGGELLHVSRVLHEMAGAGLEMVDTENLRPHYAKTLWAWSDALEARLGEAGQVLAVTAKNGNAEKILRAYRLYLAGSAMSFEQNWISLHQMLATRPDGLTPGRPDHRRAIDLPVQPRLHVRHLRQRPRRPMLFKFKSKATGDLIMLEPNGRRVLGIIGKQAGASGIILPEQMPAAISALEAAIAEEEATQKAAAQEAGVQDDDHAAAKAALVSLRQRAVPFIDMLRRAQAEGKEVVWGV